MSKVLNLLLLACVLGLGAMLYATEEQRGVAVYQRDSALNHLEQLLKLIRLIESSHASLQDFATEQSVTIREQQQLVAKQREVIEQLCAMRVPRCEGT